MTGKRTAPKILAMKDKGERIVAVTAYDVNSARLADAAEVDIVLVGDSLGNVILGYANTLPVTLSDMAHHTAAVARGTVNALLVSDMPFGSYQSSPSQAVDSAVALVRAGAEAVKLEGDYVEAVTAIVRAGIPVMGHVGMTPQSVNKFGGHKIQGKDEAAQQVMDMAKSLEAAGVFSMVLELVPATLAEAVTRSVSVPTIGIGAGPSCDGQVQVFHDVVGLSLERYKHAKRFVDGFETFRDALRRFADEVRSGEFPTSEHSF